jgi:threonine dehydratase
MCCLRNLGCVLQCKLDAIATYSGRISMCEPTMDAREATCAAIQAETGARFIHPYNYPPTICGQGTIALELLEQVTLPGSGQGKFSCFTTSTTCSVTTVSLITAVQASSYRQTLRSNHIGTSKPYTYIRQT